MLTRVTIDEVRPATPGGFPPKGVVGQAIPVSAVIFRDGHDVLAARVKWRRTGDKGWQAGPLRTTAPSVWEGSFTIDDIGAHQFVIEAWTDRYATRRHDVEIKATTDDGLATELEEGARILESLRPKVDKADRGRVDTAITGLRSETCTRDVRLNAGLDDRVAQLVTGVAVSDDLTSTKPRAIWIDRPRAGMSAWYEFFPRSEGGFRRATKRLAAVADMGFDVVYLPPIHPIGTTARKGPNNTLMAGKDDPGSPWAIGGPEGGHTAIHPDLGTEHDFDRFVAAAGELGLEVALDYALQCSPDHPWVTEHPEWFHRRPDGTIKYAENPPKKYQDIYPINFWPAVDSDRVALWEACRDVFDHWIGHDVRIFRVDNPHTKPLAFWEWVIADIHERHPDVLFLAEAFTAPAMMHKLAEVGFSQSYTYFTWRTEPWEIRQYLDELTGPSADFMRPNFWPNTPDILSGPLRNGPPAAFALRFILAATLVPNYGVYSGYELFENQPASETNEEYLFSEKYEVKARDWHEEPSLVPLITRINAVRRTDPAFADLRAIRWHHSDNDQFLAYSRGKVLVIVNLDPEHAQETTVHLDLSVFSVPWDGFTVTDELTGDRYRWTGSANYVRLDPAEGQVAHVLTVSV